MKPTDNNSYRHILKYMGIFGGVQGLNILMSIVRNKVVAVLLGTAGMGLISLFNATVRLVSDSTNLGLSMSAVRELSAAYEQGDEERLKHRIQIIRMWVALTAIAGMLLCILLSPLLNRFTFSWGNHTLHFVALSPTIAFLALAAGETAILKATRQLRQLALQSVYGVLGALLTSVPLFYVWREAAIVPAIVLAAAIQWVLVIFFSLRRYPLKFSFKQSRLSEGYGMVRLGVAFVASGILASAADFIIRSYLSHAGDIQIVGLYNAGFMVTMTYSGMVFHAMETDFFPRLSGIQNLGGEFNKIVNRQIEASTMIISPLLVAMTVGLPILLPLLFSHDFLPVIDMMRGSILAMYLRAMTLPMEYIALSRGDSRHYLLQEAVAALLLVLAVIAGFHFGGLTATGYALTVASFLEFLFVLVYTYYIYGYRLSRHALLRFVFQFSLGLITLAAVLILEGWLYWVAGIVLLAVSIPHKASPFHSSHNGNKKGSKDNKTEEFT